MTHARAAARLVLAELGPSAQAHPTGPSVAMATAARSLRDAGAEVVHGGVLASVREVVRIVEQEDPVALVLGFAGGTEVTGEAAWDPVAAVTELVAALPEVPLFGLGELACGAGMVMLPDEVEDLVGLPATSIYDALRSASVETDAPESR